MREQGIPSKESDWGAWDNIEFALLTCPEDQWNGIHEQTVIKPEEEKSFVDKLEEQLERGVSFDAIVKQL